MRCILIDRRQWKHTPISGPPAHAAPIVQWTPHPTADGIDAQ